MPFARPYSLNQPRSCIDLGEMRLELLAKTVRQRRNRDRLAQELAGVVPVPAGVGV